MREFEDKRKFEEEMATYVSIGGGTGDDFVKLKAGTVKSNDEISKEANEYMNQLAMDNIQNNMETLNEEKILENFKDIRITSCQLLDAKSKELIKKLKEDALQAEKEMIENLRKKEVTAQKEGVLETLSDRLQSENPFDDFKKHLDMALKEQQDELEKEKMEKEAINGDNSGNEEKEIEFLKA